MSMSKGPGPLGQSIGCGILMIPVLFIGGTWLLQKLVDLLTWLLD